MAVDSGDPAARTLALLWRVHEDPARGPKPRVSVDQVVAQAVALADAEGLAALSMRRVAEGLGVGTMSLYTHVPGKAELVDLMLDAVYGELPYPDDRDAAPEPGGGAPAGAPQWRHALTQVARAHRQLLHRHRWLLQVPHGRAVLGPNELAKYDRELRAVDGIGLTDVEMDTVLHLVLGHVQATVRASVDKADAVARTGMTDAQWWQTYGPLLAPLVDTERYHVAARVGAAAGAAHNAPSDPEHTFEFGLARILDGVEALLRTRNGG